MCQNKMAIFMSLKDVAAGGVCAKYGSPTCKKRDGGREGAQILSFFFLLRGIEEEEEEEEAS